MSFYVSFHVSFHVSFYASFYMRFYVSFFVNFYAAVSAANRRPVRRNALWSAATCKPACRFQPCISWPPRAVAAVPAGRPLAEVAEAAGLRPEGAAEAG